MPYKDPVTRKEYHRKYKVQSLLKRQKVGGLTAKLHLSTGGKFHGMKLKIY